MENPRPSVVHIVDDDEAVRDSTRALLESYGIEVRAYSSAGEFLAAGTGQTQGCVLLDLHMPGMSGLELLRHIKEKHHQPPPVVMMITAYGDADNYNTAMKLGADDFLTKPLEFSLLKEKLKAIH